VGIKCTSDQPKFVEAWSETSEMEGFFCNTKFVGSNADHYKNTPRKVGITVSQYAVGKGNTMYQEDLVKFDIKLVGGIIVESHFKNGLRLGQYTRTKNVRVVSLSEFDITKDVNDQQLRVRKSRESIESNQHNITLTVPRGVNSTFTTNLILTNQITGEQTTIPVKFDPSDFTGMKKVNKPKADSFSSDFESVQQKPRYDMPSRSKQPYRPDREGKGPSITSYIVLLFVVVVVGALIVDGKPLFGFINIFYDYMDQCRRGVSSARGGYYGR